MLKEKMTQENLDDLADILWWIKGYHAGAKEIFGTCPFSLDHVESLRLARVNLRDEVKIEVVHNEFGGIHER